MVVFQIEPGYSGRVCQNCFPAPRSVSFWLRSFRWPKLEELSELGYPGTTLCIGDHNAHVPRFTTVCEYIIPTVALYHSNQVLLQCFTTVFDYIIFSNNLCRFVPLIHSTAVLFPSEDIRWMSATNGVAYHLLMAIWYEIIWTHTG